MSKEYYSRNTNENISRRQLKGLTPDSTDRANIVSLIKLYDRLYPFPHHESLQRAIQEGIRRVDNQHGLMRTAKKKDGAMLVLSLPVPFVTKLKKAYPLIFSDPNQYEWFLRNFPAFDLRNY